MVAILFILYVDLSMAQSCQHGMKEKQTSDIGTYRMKDAQMASSNLPDVVTPHSDSHMPQTAPCHPSRVVRRT